MNIEADHVIDRLTKEVFTLQKTVKELRRQLKELEKANNSLSRYLTFPSQH